MDHVHMQLTGIRPVGALLRLGAKGASGAPEDKDRWHIVSPAMSVRPGKSGPDGDARKIEYHAAHPDFSRWTAQKAVAARAELVVELEHVRWADCVTIGMGKQTTEQGRAIPVTLPWCYTTGPNKAMRWNADKRHHQPHRCLGSACPEAGEAHKQHRCRPSIDLYGRLRWDGTEWAGVLPEVAVRWTSHGWASARGVLGVQEDMDRLWRALVIQTTGLTDLADAPLAEVLAEAGAPAYTVSGLRLKLRVVTQHKGGKVFTVVLAEPVQPLGDWLDQHAARTARARHLLDEARDVPAIEQRPAPKPRQIEQQAEPLQPAPPDAVGSRLERAVSWWADRAVSLATLEDWVGAAVHDWTGDHLDQLTQRARSWARDARPSA